MSETKLFDTATPYIACFVLLRRGKQAAFVLRENTNYMSGYYGLPAGKVEVGESFIAGCVREAKEEAGVTIDPKDLRHLITVHRHQEDMDWVDIYFEAMKWEGEPFNAEPEVHAELKWFDLDNMPENTVPHQKAGIEAGERGETYAEYGWDLVEADK